MGQTKTIKNLQKLKSILNDIEKQLSVKDMTNESRMLTQKDFNRLTDFICQATRSIIEGRLFEAIIESEIIESEIRFMNGFNIILINQEYVKNIPQRTLNFLCDEIEKKIVPIFIDCLNNKYKIRHIAPFSFSFEVVTPGDYI